MSITAPSTASRSAAVAYDEFAPFYDRFTAHHNYELWVRSLLEVVARASLTRRNRMLDVGCGTGKSFLPMLARGWAVTGCDLSPRMIERARAKVGDEVPLHVADVRALPRFGEFDLVWCLDDVLNYLRDPDELERALRGLRVNLAPGGVLLFDLNTLASYRGFFSEDETRHDGHHRFDWRGSEQPPEPGGAIEAVLEVVDMRMSARVVARSVHNQRHFTQREVASALRRAGLTKLAVYGHGFDARLEQPLDEADHTKAIVLARRS
jgi:SAM-dependent methyltransferase